jgi:hypothetical protein
VTAATASHLTERGLPKFCPPWCTQPHEQALDEGCTVEEASIHIGPDLCGSTHDASNPYTGEIVRPGSGGWSVVLRQPEGPEWRRVPIIELELEGKADRPGGVRDRVQLTLVSGEARTLAAQLLHLADQTDLHW